MADSATKIPLQRLGYIGRIRYYAICTFKAASNLLLYAMYCQHTTAAS